MTNPANDNGLEYDAPASLADLVCTECACCSRTLTDAQSAERGIGPECFGRYYDKCAGAADFVTAVRVASTCGLLELIGADLNRQDARAACNVVLRAISAQWDHPKRVERIELVHALGFTALANRLEERAFGIPGMVTVTERDGLLVVKLRGVKGAAFSEFVDALRAIPSRRWTGRENTVSTAHRKQLWNALRTHLPGRKLKTANGVDYVPGRILRAADAA